MLNPIFFIQSRLSSTRLPCKAGLLVPGGANCLKTLVFRLQDYLNSKAINGTIYVACPSEDVHCVNFLLDGTDATVFGGDEKNVAKRFYELASHNSVIDFVRITGDNPFVCFDVLDLILNFQYAKGKECISLYHQKSLPNGTVVSKMSIRYLQSILDVQCSVANEHIVITKKDCLQELIQNPDIPENMIWPCGRFCLDDYTDYIYLSKNPLIYKYKTVEQIRQYLSYREVNESY